MKREIALWVGVLGLLAGCGGKVVFVEDDGSGASGVGGAGPGPGPGSGPAQTSTSTGIETVCQSYCSVYSACDVGFDCATECEGLFTGQCDSELTAALVCLTNNFIGCEDENFACSAELEVFNACQNTANDCVTEFCEDGPDGSCYCSGICFDEIKLEQQCFFLIPGDGNGGQPGGGPPPPPPTTCDCYFDGKYFGSCDNFEFACSIEEGCCQTLVLSDGAP